MKATPTISSLCLLVACGMLLVAVWLMPTASSEGAVPQMINYQGKLTTAEGGCLNDTVSMTFTIYSDDQGTVVDWTETQTEVIVKEGIFNVLLGSVNPVPDTVFDGSTKYLGVRVESDPEMTPLKPMVSVAYAFRSVESDTAQFAVSAAPDDDWEVDTAGLNVYRLTGGVGIGTPSPQEKLDVDGNIKASGTITSGSSITIDGVDDKITATSGTIDFDDENIVTTGKATIGPGNTNTGTDAFVAGRDNTASNIYSTVSGGNTNTSSGTYSTVSGGSNNTADSNGSTVGGGGHNTANGDASTISGGSFNTTDHHWAVIGGGYDNFAGGQYATVSGGAWDTASAQYSTIGGGSGNTASQQWATIGGGRDNTASREMSTVGGGWGNVTSNQYSTVGGGHDNTASGVASIVGGGQSNTASGDYHSTVSGGRDNTASGGHSTVGGGNDNTASDQYNTVGGGLSNTASGHNGSTVGGGKYNTSSGNASTVGGGASNTASGDLSTVSGGRYNSAAGDYSVIPGGDQDTLTAAAHYSLAFGAQVYVNNQYRVVLFDSTFSGRVGINRDDHDGGISYPIHVGTNSSNGNGAYLSTDGLWTDASSKGFKTDFQPLDGEVILTQISNLSLESWRYKGTQGRHIGPYAEDFAQAFGIGSAREDGKLENRYLATSDVAGVALAGVKELVQQNKKLRQIIEQLKENNALLEARVADLERTR